VRVYLDAAPVIYLVEQVMPFAAEVLSRLSESDLVLVASDLTKMECLVKPVREKNAALVEDYRIQFDEAIDEVVPLTSEMLSLATEIRAHYDFATPDAIHFAAGVVSRCDLFLTNDQRLTQFTDITVEVIAGS